MKAFKTYFQTLKSAMYYNYVAKEKFGPNVRPTHGSGHNRYGSSIGIVRWGRGGGGVVGETVTHPYWQ